MFVSTAVNDGSAAVNFLVLGSGLKIESQFAPERNCSGGEEGDAAFPDLHRMFGWENSISFSVVFGESKIPDVSSLHDFIMFV